jgi:alkylhydroperoxidase/carboxymuconolactone decarboxylase family protein YurZ
MNDKVPRLEFDDLDNRLAETLRPRVERLGYLGKFFKVMGHNPDVLRHFMDMTEALKRALPDRLTELGALTVAAGLGNDYERHQHERLCEKLGFARSWIAAVTALAPDSADALSRTERVAQRLALALLGADWAAARGLFDRLVDNVGHQQACAYLMLVGRYATHAMVINVFGLAPPVPSIFAREAGSW